MEYNREVAEYFEKKGVSVILLLRRNVLKRLISILANAYDRREKPLNGTHKSHVHSKEEVLLSSLPTCRLSCPSSARVAAVLNSILCP